MGMVESNLWIRSKEIQTLALKQGISSVATKSSSRLLARIQRTPFSPYLARTFRQALDWLLVPALTNFVRLPNTTYKSRQPIPMLPLRSRATVWAAGSLRSWACFSANRQ